MVFKAIPSKTSAADDCLAAIERVIVCGELKPGDRLPPERTLATMLERNRLTVRNALGRLADAGLLSVRQGSGYVVQDLNRTAGPAMLPRLLEVAEENDRLHLQLIEILRIRRSLAQALLESLSEKGADLSFEAFDAATDALSKGLANDICSPRMVFELDVQLIRSLLDAAKSMPLTLFMNGLTQGIESSPRIQSAIYGRAKELLAGYRLLRLWLANRNPREINQMIRQLQEHDRLILNEHRTSEGLSDSLAS